MRVAMGTFGRYRGLVDCALTVADIVLVSVLRIMRLSLDRVPRSGGQQVPAPSSAKVNQMHLRLIRLVRRKHESNCCTFAGILVGTALSHVNGSAC